ncbi:ribonuclease III [Acidisoma silvae]|uniref:Ribonuclease 3 n=1 Tax=Acidisoma silvae TaxID=2802396 RepID=A0A964DXX2_9PROT|nr:ribonuclease III [Acidisoma silvae]MCB8874666.1 ribonuclease III [Acidisoma silvae]
MAEEARAAVEQILGYRFANPRLLQEALTHRSAAGAGQGSNERLEFLGDRVLGLTISVWLTEHYPREQEGALGRRLAQLVSQPVLAEVAERLGLPALLSVAPGEARAGVRRRASVLADAVEALLGAMFLDGGLDPVQHFVRANFASAMLAAAEPPKDAKTGLQEWGQARGLGLPAYDIVSRDGPSHEPHFVISVRLGETEARGEAGSRRAAEQEAAQALLDQLRRATDGKAKPGPNNK